MRLTPPDFWRHGAGVQVHIDSGGRRLRRLLEPGATELGFAGTQPNEGYPGRGCAKVHPAAGGVTSPAAAYGNARWTPAPCLRKSRGAGRAGLRRGSEVRGGTNLRRDPHESRMDLVVPPHFAMEALNDFRHHLRSRVADHSVVRWPQRVDCRPQTRLRCEAKEGGVDQSTPMGEAAYGARRSSSLLQRSWAVSWRIWRWYSPSCLCISACWLC